MVWFGGSVSTWMPGAVGRRCMAKMNQFSWSSSWLVDEEIGRTSPPLRDQTWPREQRRSCAPEIYESTSSADRTCEGAPGHAGGPFSDRSGFRANRDLRSACQRLQQDAVALGRGNQIGDFLGSA